MRNKPPRLSDVAGLAGTSEATASRAVNGRPGVAEETRERVYEAIRELGYVRGSRVADVDHARVGIILPHIDNPIFARLASALSLHFVAARHSPMFGLLSEVMVETDAVAAFRASRVAGIVFVSGNHANAGLEVDHYRRLRADGMPIVLVNGVVDGLDVPMAATDDDRAITLVLDHLVALGHRRIGLAIGPDRYRPTRVKVAAFTREAASRDLDTAPVVHTDYSLTGGARAMEELGAHDVTAVVAGSDLMAMGVIRRLRDRGLAVPRDVSVVGYDDSWLMGEVQPPLTTVRQDVNALTRHVAETLLHAIAGDDDTTDVVLFAPELVVRDSTAVRRA